MKIDNEFTVSVPIDRAWQVLTDLEGVSLCLPGARLTGVENDVYSGEVRIKVGPVVSEYAGTAQFLEKDDAGYRAVIDAKGRDSRGAGNASALITVQLRAADDHTVVTVDTDLKISGKIAQLGGGMIKDVSQKLLGQFVECLEGKFAAPVSSEKPVVTSSEKPVVTAPAEIPVEPAVAEGLPEVAEQHDPGPTASPVRPQAASQPMPAQEPLDLMAVAGGALTKRLIPVVLVVALVLAVVVYLFVR